MSLAPAPVLRRACACGGTPGPTGECAACRARRLGLRRQASAAGPAAAPPVVHDVLASAGRPLDGGVRAEMEPRFGHSFADVRVHADGRAADSARAVSAHAYTVGRDVVFAAGRYAPQSAEGRRLIAHELAHVVQQRGASPSIPPRLEIGGVDDPAEREADAAAGQRTFAAGRDAGVVLRRAPAYLVSHTFLGWPCRGGVNPLMRQRLVQVERHLQARFNGLPAAERVNPVTGAPAATLRDWSGILEPHGCWRPNASLHSSGSACDINYATNPYIATRTPGPGGGTTYGGELAGAGLRQERRAATAVYDRAAAFVNGAGSTADVSARRAGVPARAARPARRGRPAAPAVPAVPRETTAEVYRRFRGASDALREYLSYAFRAPDPANDHVHRPPVRNPETATEADLLRIPLTERLPEDEAIHELRHLLENHEFQVVHPGWAMDARELYFRMLRDYELVRVPMLYGAPTARPGHTRNPALGFVNLRQELVEALVDVGQLRWGASDFGAAQSGDVQHFDLGGHHGFAPGN